MPPCSVRLSGWRHGWRQSESRCYVDRTGRSCGGPPSFALEATRCVDVLVSCFRVTTLSSLARRASASRNNEPLCRAVALLGTVSRVAVHEFVPHFAMGPLGLRQRRESCPRMGRWLCRLVFSRFLAFPCVLQSFQHSCCIIPNLGTTTDIKWTSYAGCHGRTCSGSGWRIPLPGRAASAATTQAAPLLHLGSRTE